MIENLSNSLGTQMGDVMEIGTYRGFKVGLYRTAYVDILLSLTGEQTYKAEKGFSGSGNTVRLDHIIEGLPNALQGEERELEEMRQQLEEAKIAVNVPFEYEQQLADQAAEQISIETALEFEKGKVESVIADDNDDQKEVNLQPKKETGTSLVDTIKNNDGPQFEKRLSSGADIQSLENGTTPLHAAVQCGHYQFAKRLLESGCLVDALDSHEKTPLYDAVLADSSQMANLLLDHGADPDICVRGIPVKDCTKSERMDELIYNHIQERQRGLGTTRGAKR
jgi:hypothetical protein